MQVLKRRLEKSEKYWERAKKVIPAGTQTLSKGPTQYVQGVAPKYLKSGKGSHVFDVDGNEYIDYAMALHPVILGYSYPRVNEAIRRQLEDGTTFSLMHPLEVEVSEMLVDTVPCAEMVRFGKSGSDATSAAVRVARAFTGRDKIASEGYHGWHDWYIGTTEHSKGVPQAVKALTETFRYNDIESLRQVFAKNEGEIAAVIMEPVGIVEPEPGFLQEVKDLSHKNGALLIFDEVISGFRMSLGGAQEFFGVTPDLAAFGKAMANGMPISALVGRTDVMSQFNEVFFSHTFGGETLSLAASLATVSELREKKVIPYLWRQGKKLQEAYQKIAEEAHLESGYTISCIGYPPRNVIAFRDVAGKDCLEMKSLFQQEMIKRGILFPGYNAISFSHSDEDIEKTIEAYVDSMKIVAKAAKENNFRKYLEGGVVSPVFRNP